LLCYLGQPEAALESAGRALRLSPYDPRMGLWLAIVAQAHYFLQEYEEAATIGRKALAMIPENPLALRFSTAALGQLSRTSDAETLLERVRQSTAPSIDSIKRSISKLYRHEEMIRHLLDGLRKAGLD
jgi:tetratricopeptide (TPR) repeat protein